MPSISPVEAAIEFLESDHAKGLLGLAKIRVGGHLLDRQAIAALLRVVLLTGTQKVEAKPLPESTHERRAFYQNAMLDEKNHAALAFELAYLRQCVDPKAIPPTDKQMVEAGWARHHYAQGTKEAIAFNNGVRWLKEWYGNAT